MVSGTQIEGVLVEDLRCLVRDDCREQLLALFEVFPNLERLDFSGPVLGLRSGDGRSVELVLGVLQLGLGVDVGELGRWGSGVVGVEALLDWREGTLGVARVEGQVVGLVSLAELPGGNHLASLLDVVDGGGELSPGVGRGEGGPVSGGQLVGD